MSLNGDSGLENGELLESPSETYSVEVGVAKLDETSYREHMRHVKVIESPDITRRSVIKSEFGVDEDEEDSVHGIMDRGSVSEDTGIFSEHSVSNILEGESQMNFEHSQDMDLNFEQTTRVLVQDLEVMDESPDEQKMTDEHSDMDTSINDVISEQTNDGLVQDLEVIDDTTSRHLDDHESNLEQPEISHIEDYTSDIILRKTNGELVQDMEVIDESTNQQQDEHEHSEIPYKDVGNNHVMLELTNDRLVQDLEVIDESTNQKVDHSHSDDAEAQSEVDIVKRDVESEDTSEIMKNECKSEHNEQSVELTNEEIAKEHLDSKADLDDIPTNLVKRLSLQFSDTISSTQVDKLKFHSPKSKVKVEERKDGAKAATSKTVKTTEETTTKTKEAGAGQVSTTTTKTTREVVQNGDIGNTEEIRFDEMSNIKTKFESGESGSMETQHKPTVQEEIMSVEGGVYENEPVRDPNVVREADRAEEELPEVGYAKNILNKFKEIQVEKSQPVTSQRRVTPERQSGPVEYVSEPRASVPVPEQKLEGGIFENEPKYEEGVVRSYDAVEDVKPEHGYARNVLAKFKEIESTTKNMPPPSPKRELTPDRFTKGEYVSEPRTVFEKYEGKTEAGIFESQPTEARDIVKSGEMVDEPLPEIGTAKSLASKFAQYESQAKSPTSPQQKKELTPDRFTKGEYVSEPRTVFQHYEAKEESGIYESQPQERPEVVKSGEYTDEPLPEQGYAKNVISKFREIQSGTSPASSPQRPREITPPRGDTFSGVLESTPQERPDVVKSDQQFEEALPEAGMAKNLVSKFRQIQTTSQSPTSPRQKKEFTPPPQSGVYENTPAQSLVVENRPVESGILETAPQVREGVAREGDVSAGDIEFPEQGYARNMVSKWKQIESESAKSTPSPRYKEFTPPRDDIRTARGPMSPRSPAGVDSSVHPSDLPGQYQEQISPGVFENQPERRDDIVREEDTDWAEGLPKEGTSKSLISKFKQVQDQAKKSQETPKPISRKDSTDDSAPQNPNTQMFERRNENEAVRNGVRSSPIATPKNTFAVQLDKCAACQKTVYAMEKVEMNKNLYHRACFKCSHCNTRLTAKTFSLNEGIMYCTNHFKQLFARKGNYDEGFGRQQYKKRWQGDSPNEQSSPQNSA